MWFFTEEEKMLQKSVADFAQRVVTPKAAELDEKEGFNREAMKGLAELGLLGVTASEADGGAGMGCVAATIAMEELGAVCASTALSYLAHSILFVNNLATNGNAAQKKKFLPKAIDGSWVCGMGMSEPGAGTDALGMTTKAEKKGGKWILNGTKMWITNAVVGDAFYVYARTGQGKNDISTFVVDKSCKGFSFGKKLPKLGMRASPTGELVFENCEVPEENLVGTQGKSVAAMIKNLDIERITISGISLGLARASLEAATKYATERKQFGKAIGDYQLVQKKLADGQAEYESARAYCYSAAKEWDLGLLSGGSSRSTGAKVKIIASEMATKVAMDAIQILGGYGYTKEFPVERYMRDAKLMEIGAGTTEILQVVTAKEMLAAVK
jgi:isovaleryl-CoA dehydrogenase